MTRSNEFVLIGFGAHALHICEILFSYNQKIAGYFEQEEKAYNPFNIKYLGKDSSPDAVDILRKHPWIVAFDNNHFRKFITTQLLALDIGYPATAIHRDAQLQSGTKLDKAIILAEHAFIDTGTVLGFSTIINRNAKVGRGCILGDYTHVGPHATLEEKVNLGERSFVGAGSIISAGVTVGAQVRILSGSHVRHDLPEGVTVQGKPARIIDKSVPKFG